VDIAAGTLGVDCQMYGQSETGSFYSVPRKSVRKKGQLHVAGGI